MPKARKKPAYLLHSPSGQARVRIHGRDHYLGPHGSPESLAEYDQLIAEWYRTGDVVRSAITVDALCLRFLDHAETYYRNSEGTPTTEPANIRVALRPLIKIFGTTPARDFSPLKLKAVRQEMIATGLCRTSINRQIQRIKLMFRWAVENELVPASTHHALSAVRGLSAGRTDAIESEPVKPVPSAYVEAIEEHTSPTIWAMVQIQLLSGCRPGELVLMRPCDLITSGPVWEYHPQKHKNQHRGHDRVIMIGPRGQALLRPLLPKSTEEYVFSPARAEAERNEARRRNRQTPLTPSQAARQRSANRKRPPAEKYTVDSYRRAVARACEKAGVPVWHCHQLRHSRGTELRRQFGLEASKAALGHATIQATQHYAEIDLQRSREIALQVG